MEIFLIIIVFIVVWFFTSTSKSEDVRSAIRFAKEAKDETNKFLYELSENIDEFNKDFEERTEKYIIESKRNILKKQKEHLVWLSELDDIDDINKSIKSMGLDGIDEDVTSIVDNFKEAGRYEEISHLVIKKSSKSGFFSPKEEKYIINHEYSKIRREKATRERVERERVERERVERERVERERVERERVERERAERERAERERAERERVERERVERERVERERAERERAERERTQKPHYFEDVSHYIKEIDGYLIDFLKIRFYLSNRKEYPAIKCIDKYFKSKFPQVDERLYISIWSELAGRIAFDENKRKNISSIYHFTHKSNLASILEYGVLTRTNLNKMSLKYTFNDQMRLDGILDSISLSFSHPNFKMFYKYRKQTGNEDWVVLKISPSLLYGRERCISNRIKDFNYLNKAVFCHTNAASNKVRNLSIDERMTCNAFLEMFESPIGKSLPTYTYDNQAEILYLSDIPVDFIEEIYIHHQDESLNWVRELGYKVTENDIVFDKRRYRDG
ncbi:DarT ssDNA thymidine ADP-ribosyltransferase family protein [Psychrobacter sp. APC 3426]|uniref:DarT ssDNA thymidine ADP-ribosyltransferase family protein n=1 Tax=Psychrobacter sp. APC 3426 TaxID=3035177 RepID=UPI0025B5D2A3|nr:DarT ssDNA thymidine ADP-ribosyltransferase family protein [Psychrobacter sp. APC 3426]MDN3399539.1 DarT ssDNA thymidine ADP-ribosyltransferase family protein [Psychrobacter sp. APC 3426]